jgi:hypothetical protein
VREDLRRGNSSTGALVIVDLPAQAPPTRTFHSGIRALMIHGVVVAGGMLALSLRFNLGCHGLRRLLILCGVLP